MEKINIAELLKNCPKGMELDCSVFEDVTLYKIDTDIENEFPIRIKTKNDYFLDLTKCGTYSNVEEAKCLIFPKGKTTWEGFVPPYQFKDGDVIVTKLGSIFILKNPLVADTYSCYVALNHESKFICKEQWFGHKDMCRLATEDEKQKLFDAIKANGYKWNAETKTLEKLNEPNFHVGDWVTDGVSKCQIHFIDDTQYWYSKNCILGSIESVDKRYHLWTIDDAKDGDVLAEDSCIFIIQKLGDNSTAAKTYCTLYDDGDFDGGSILYFDIDSIKPAQEEEKEKLFRAIKDNGYKWDSENKILEKLTESKENIDDRIVMSDIYFNMEDYADEVELHLSNYEIEIRDGRTYAILKNQKTKTSEKSVKPIFRVGDTIQNKVDKWLSTRTIKSFTEGIGYFTTINDWIRINEQDEWELVSNKFDITTLVPFESRVLVREDKKDVWRPTFYGFFHQHSKRFYTTSCGTWLMCIPYNEKTMHLTGTTNDCNDFYKTWEK